MDKLKLAPQWEWVERSEKLREQVRAPALRIMPKEQLDGIIANAKKMIIENGVFFSAFLMKKYKIDITSLTTLPAAAVGAAVDVYVSATIAKAFAGVILDDAVFDHACLDFLGICEQTKVIVPVIVKRSWEAAYATVKHFVGLWKEQITNEAELEAAQQVLADVSALMRHPWGAAIISQARTRPQ